MEDSKIQHPKKRAFLAAYAELGTITHAATAAGIDRNTHTQWLKVDAEYATAFEDAKQQAIEKLEREAVRRASEGIDKPIFYQGHLVTTIKEYSDTLLIFLLKGLKPERYRDRLEHGLSDGAAAQIKEIVIEKRYD